MSFKPIKLQSENARLRDEIRNLQRALKDISKDAVISNSPSPIRHSPLHKEPRPKPLFRLDESYQSSARRSPLASAVRSPLAKPWTPSKKENASPYTYVANFGTIGTTGKAKLTTTKHSDFEHYGVSPTFRDCSSPASELSSERSDRRDQATMADTKYDSQDLEFYPSISRVVDTKSGMSMSSSLSSDLHRIECLSDTHIGKAQAAKTPQAVKDTFSSFYDVEDSEEPRLAYVQEDSMSDENSLEVAEASFNSSQDCQRLPKVSSPFEDPKLPAESHYDTSISMEVTEKSQYIVTLEPEPQSVQFTSTPKTPNQSISYREAPKHDSSSSSLMKTIQELREENRLLRTKIGQKKPALKRSKSPSMARKSPSPRPFNTVVSRDAQLLKPVSPLKKSLTPPKSRGRQLSKPKTARNPASTSRQGSARAYTSRSAGRNKSAVLRVRHCDTCDHLLSKGFSTVYCSKHGKKSKNDRSSSIDLLTQRSFEAIHGRNAL